MLYLDTQCQDQHLINALTMLPDLVELYLGVVRPDGAGKTFFGALQAKQGKISRSLRASHVSMLCPNLRTFRIRYCRWVHDDESDKITPLLHNVVGSMQRTDTPLQSLKFWFMRELSDDSFLDLCTHSKDSHSEDEPLVFAIWRGCIPMLFTSGMAKLGPE